MSAHRRARRRDAVAGAVRLALLAGVAAGLCAARPALAFVRYKTATGLGFFWPQTCVPLTVYPNSLTDMNGHMLLPAQQLMTTATAAATTWGTDSNACTYLRINVSESTGPTPEARYDYKNSLIFDTIAWCGPLINGLCSYDSSALAITSVFADKSTGQIKDADMEINAQGFTWGDLVADPSLVGHAQDLQNAITHEMGHLIGLDHTCYIAGTVATPPIDNDGNPVPDCATASAAVLATTMAATANPGDTGKRTLAPDDIDAVCTVYPIAMDPMKCPAADAAPPSHLACAYAGDDGVGARAGLAAAGLMALAALARRRRSRT